MNNLLKADENEIFNLSLIIKNISGSLERIIRTIRHRGFEMLSLNVTLSHDANTANLEVQVCSERRLSTLTRQLEKLYDVQTLKIVGSAFDELNYAKAELNYAKSA